MNYQGVTLLDGKLCIPYVVLQTFPDGLSPEQVKIEFTEPFELKGPLAEYKAKILNRKLKQAEKTGTVFRNDPVARLKDYFPDEDNQRLGLILQRAEYYDHEASNKALDRRPKEFGGKRIRTYYNLHPKELDDVLANVIGVNAVFLTTDSTPCVILTERSKKLHQYPDLLGIPAGFMSPEKDATPFDTAARDAALEDVGRRVIPEELKLVELGRSLDDLHIEINMVGKIDGNSRQITEAIRRADWEHKKLFTDTFDPRACAKYLARTITEIPLNVPKSAWVIGKSPKWVPAQHRALYLALSKEYGQEEVDKELEKVVT